MSWNKGQRGKRWPARTAAQMLEYILNHCRVTEKGCWEWRSSRARSDGYVQASFNNKVWRVHRYAYTIAIGPIPPMLDVLHTCDNPPCCNPDHLFVGTQRDNMLDCIGKGRHPTPEKTHCAKGHAYSEHGKVSKTGWRRCILCDRARLRILAGWPEDLAFSLPRTSLGYRPVNSYNSERRSHADSTRCRNGHPRTPDNTYIPPRGTKQCKVCMMEARKRHWAKSGLDASAVQP